MVFCQRLKPGLSAVLLICTLSMFLFAAPVGPYSAVHGPATAMRAAQASLALFWVLTAVLNSLVVPLRFVAWAFPLAPEIYALPIQDSKLILRC